MIRSLAITALIAGLALATHAAAQILGRSPFGGLRGDLVDPRETTRSDRVVPLSRCLAAITARTKGRHLDADQGRAGGRPVYYVQWLLPDGRVVIVVVDAETCQTVDRDGR